MEVQGKLIVKNETQTFGEKGFRKREFVIETVSDYPQKIQIELIQDKTELLDKFNLGDTLKVAYNLNGREWINPEGIAKYFNSIQGWRIDKATEPVGEIEVTAEEVKASDDLPF